MKLINTLSHITNPLAHVLFVFVEDKRYRIDNSYHEVLEYRPALFDLDSTEWVNTPKGFNWE